VQIYKHRWLSQEGEAKNPDGSLTENFALWARKTSQLTDEQWRIGFDAIERRVSKLSALGKTAFPPTYAEFMGMCNPISSPTGINSAAYMPFNKESALEDHSKRTLSNDENKSRLAELKKELSF